MLPLKSVKGIGTATEEKLACLGIKDVLSLLSYLPSKYIDLKSPVNAHTAEAGQFCVLEGELMSVTAPERRGKQSFRATFSDCTAVGKVFYAHFFNQPYLAKTLEAGARYRLLAKPVNSGRSASVVNPVFERADVTGGKLDGVYTVYPLKGILGQGTFKNLVARAFDSVRELNFSDDVIADFLDTLKDSHFPSSAEEGTKARKKLAEYDMAFALAIYNLTRDLTSKKRKVFYKSTNNEVVCFENALPFALSPSQKITLSEICEDMQSDFYMSRMVTGDVGSGKTVTGFFACAKAALSGLQAAFVAPTEILARQHYEKLSPIAEKLGFDICLYTGSTPSALKKEYAEKIKNGKVAVAIGTHALFNKDLKFANLSVAVIDEQQRFGVAERAVLEEKGARDILSLTATPIPRSLALAFLKDVGISSTERRADAKFNVATKIVSDGKLEDMLAFLKDRAKMGASSFIVCPSIYDSEGYDAFSLETLAERYSDYFSDEGVAVLHGKMKSEEKNEAFKAFSEGRCKLLFATGVVEVGVDTDAENIAVLNADRFGLSSLHQLRGRVGRRGGDGYCFLHTASTSEKAIERLGVLANNDRGSDIAEYDFKTRGAGEFLGMKQSGIALTPLFNLTMNLETLTEAKTLCKRIAEECGVEYIRRLLGETYSRIPQFIDSIRDVTLNS